jgi:beta-N-acetylhexosaminidase
MGFSNWIERPRLWTTFHVILVVAILPCFCLPEGNAEQDEFGPVSLTQEGREWVEQTLTSLSLEEKVGQMLQVPYYADYKDFDSRAYGAIRDQLQKYHIGSVILSTHFSRSNLVKSSSLNAARIANQLQRDSKLPLLLAADMERGAASRVSDAPAFPWPMAFGAVNNVHEVEQFAAITARQARAIGIQWAVAPVADVNSNPNNSVINVRSFGEDPEQVGALVAAYIRGAHKRGLLVTAKHFPGHGDTSGDSHRGIASVDGNLAHLQKVEFPPFQRAITAGVDSILLAHASVPALEPDPRKIATISFNVISRVLKGQLGFKGVVLTDALEMRGLTALYDPQSGNPAARAAVDTIKAGSDVIMLLLASDLDGAFQAVVESVRSGEIPESRIDESVRKILQMKASVGLNRSRFVDLEQVSKLVSKPEDTDFAQHVADEAVTLVRDNGQVLPLQKTEESVLTTERTAVGQPEKHPLVVIILAQALERTPGREFQRVFQAHRPDAAVYFVDKHIASAMSAEVLKAVSEAQKVVIGAYLGQPGSTQKTADGNSGNPYGEFDPSSRLLQQMLAIASEKIVVIAFGSPFLIENFPQIRTYLCTYATAPSSENSAVKALFGEIPMRGKLPVTLPGVAARGFSLEWPTRQQRQ